MSESYYERFLTEKRKIKTKLKRPRGRFQSGAGNTAEARGKRSVEQRARKAAQQGKFVRAVPGGYQIVDPDKHTVKVITPGRSHSYLVNKGRRDRPVGHGKRGGGTKSQKQAVKAPIKRRQALYSLRGAYGKKYKK